jgi:hypothetical protein
MFTTCYDEYNIYKNGNTDKFKRSRHPKEISKRINANQKKEDQFKEHIYVPSISQNISNKKVNKLPKCYINYYDNWPSFLHFSGLQWGCGQMLRNKKGKNKKKYHIILHHW